MSRAMLSGRPCAQSERWNWLTLRDLQGHERTLVARR